ncbi:MAG: hypothetical protein KDB00_09130 [Planctomycetales bacterium]|nr:hypothetical protein [Planctomycetales bacterium]
MPERTNHLGQSKFIVADRSVLLARETRGFEGLDAIFSPSGLQMSLVEIRIDRITMGLRQLNHTGDLTPMIVSSLPAALHSLGDIQLPALRVATIVCITTNAGLCRDKSRKFFQHI